MSLPDVPRIVSPDWLPRTALTPPKIVSLPTEASPVAVPA